MAADYPGRRPATRPQAPPGGHSTLNLFGGEAGSSADTRWGAKTVDTSEPARPRLVGGRLVRGGALPQPALEAGTLGGGRGALAFGAGWVSPTHASRLAYACGGEGAEPSQVPRRERRHYSRVSSTATNKDSTYSAERVSHNGSTTLVRRSAGRSATRTARGSWPTGSSGRGRPGRVPRRGGRGARGAPRAA
jgi:hypothetical protein